MDEVNRIAKALSDTVIHSARGFEDLTCGRMVELYLQEYEYGGRFDRDAILKIIVETVLKEAHVRLNV